MSRLLFYLAISKLKAQPQKPGRHELTAQLAEKAWLLAVRDDLHFLPVSTDGALNGSGLDIRHMNFIFYIYSLPLILGGSAHIVVSCEPVGCSSMPTRRASVGATKSRQFSQCLSPHGARSVPTSLITHQTRQRLHSSPSAGWGLSATVLYTRCLSTALLFTISRTNARYFHSKGRKCLSGMLESLNCVFIFVVIFFRLHNWEALNNETKPQKYPCELWLLLPAGSHFLIWSVLLLIQW